MNYLTMENPCDLAISVDLCFIVRFTMIFCMVCFANLQFAMVAERWVALWKRTKYETFGKKLGLSFSSLSIAAAFIFTAWCLRREEFSIKPYCTLASPRTLERITILCFVLCGVNLATSIGMAILITSNHIAVRSKRFDLRSSYQISENYSVIRLLLPITMFQNICFAFFTIASALCALLVDKLDHITFRVLFLLVYVIPFYTLVSPILIWYMISKSQRMKTSKLSKVIRQQDKVDDVYFGAYSKMWESRSLAYQHLHTLNEFPPAGEKRNGWLLYPVCLLLQIFLFNKHSIP